jgi:hypothetical protein
MGGAVISTPVTGPFGSMIAEVAAGTSLAA